MVLLRSHMTSDKLHLKCTSALHFIRTGTFYKQAFESASFQGKPTNIMYPNAYGHRTSVLSV